MSRLAAYITTALFAGCCLAAWCVADMPTQGIAREAVDLIEVNRFYDEHGRLVFDQVIFYDWSQDDARYMVRAWRLVKNPAQLPRRDWAGGGYCAVWQDGDLMRRIQARSFRETWTQYDPELLERDVLPKERRRELATIRLRPRKNWSTLLPPDVQKQLEIDLRPREAP